MSELNRFDRIAPYYEGLKRLVFGKAIHEAEICFLDFIKPGSNVLIWGGGSGEMLRVLLNIKYDCKVWYVEASETMIELATKSAGAHASRVVFVHGTQRSAPRDFKFDAVITNFFLDLFPEEKIAGICDMHTKVLAPDGMWIITEFVDRRRWWQRLLLSVMYRFFRTACTIEADRLPAWEQIVGAHGFNEKHVRIFYGAFIKASLWVKSPFDTGELAPALPGKNP